MILTDLLDPHITRVISNIIKGIKTMPTYPDVITAVTEIAEAQSVTQLALASVDAKLDEVRSLIQGLQGGTPVTQEQLDALFLALDAVRITTLANRVTADAVLAETTQIVP